MTDTTMAQQLAQEVGAGLVQAKSGSYSRIVLGKRTLAYQNPTYLDFKADDVAKAPKAACGKLTIKGNRAHLPIGEKRAAVTLLKHVAEQAR